jgi:hypothetical protein
VATESLSEKTHSFVKLGISGSSAWKEEDIKLDSFSD